MKITRNRIMNGSGLIFSIILLLLIIVMAVTLSSLTVLETKLSSKTKSSVGAFYNSESGVEWALNEIASKSSTESIYETFVATGFDESAAKCPASFGMDICKVYFLKNDSTVITMAEIAGGAQISEIKAVRSIGLKNTNDETSRAIEAAVADTVSGNYTMDCFFGDYNTVCWRLNKSNGKMEVEYTDDPYNEFYKISDNPFSAATGSFDGKCDYLDGEFFCYRINVSSGSVEIRHATNLEETWENSTDEL